MNNPIMHCNKVYINVIHLSQSICLIFFEAGTYYAIQDGLDSASRVLAL